MDPRAHPYYSHMGSLPSFFEASVPQPPFDYSNQYPFPYQSTTSKPTRFSLPNNSYMYHNQPHQHPIPISPVIAYNPNSEYHELPLPRTAILRGLSSSLSVRQVLDSINFGPIEYVYLKKPTERSQKTKSKKDLNSEPIDTSSLSLNGTLNGNGAEQSSKSNDDNIVQENGENPGENNIADNTSTADESSSNDGVLVIEALKSTDPSESSISTANSTCYLLFIDPQTCSHFYRTFRNKANLESLRGLLKSPILKVSLNDPERPDFIKMKTLNYIIEKGATRCLEITLPNDTEPQEVQAMCAKFGDVELFEEVNESPVDEDSKRVNEMELEDPEKSTDVKKYENDYKTDGTGEIDEIPNENESDANTSSSSNKFQLVSFRTHFTSIDLAIRCYEHFTKNCKHPGKTSVLFGVDRCTMIPSPELKTPSPKAAPRKINKNYTTNPPSRPRAVSNLHSYNSSSSSNVQNHNFLPDDSIISIPEDNSYGLDNSEALSDYILENQSHHGNSTASVSSRHTQMAYNSNQYPNEHLHSNQHRHSHSHHQLPQQHHSYLNMKNYHHPTLLRSMSTMAPPPDITIPEGPYSPYIRSLDYIPSPSINPYFMSHQIPPLAPIVDQNVPQMNGSQSYFPTHSDSNVGNRTIYLGNIHPNSTVEEIANNVRAGGLVQLFKYYKEKRVCFITFVDAAVALKFYLNHQVLHQLVIHGYDITVGWANQHSGPLNREILLAVSAGASRNVYIGIKPAKDEPEAPGNQKVREELPSEEEMRADFSAFGDMEQINFYHNRDCGFLNFMNIQDAIKLVDAFAVQNINKINKIAGDEGQFYEKYKNFKINFAKDRCGNPPKFTIKKKPPKNISKMYRDEDLYEVDIVNELRESSRMEEEMRLSLTLKESPPLNEETAMVFGIIQDKENDNEDTSKGLGLLSINENGLQNGENVIGDLEGDEIDVDDEVVNDESVRKTTKTSERETKSKNNDVDKDITVDNASEDEDEDDEEDDDDDDDEEEDDEVSIIIFSEIDDQKAKENSLEGKKKFYKSKPESHHKKVFSHNGSSISLNSGHSGFFHPSQTPYQSKNPSSPYVSSQHQLYYHPQHRSQSTPGRLNGYGYHTSSGLPSPIPNSGGVPMPYGGGYMPYPPAIPMMGQGSFKGQYVTSGSQVMAQYLAQAQHEGYMYANALYNNQAAMLEENEHYYRRRRKT